MFSGLDTSPIYMHVTSEQREAASSFLFSPPVEKASRLPEVCSHCQSYFNVFFMSCNTNTVKTILAQQDDSENNRAEEGQSSKITQLHSLEGSWICQLMKAEAPRQNQPVTVTSISRPNARVSPRPLTRCFAVRRVLDVLFFLKAGVGLQHCRRASHHEFPKKTLASKKLLKMEKKSRSGFWFRNTEAARLFDVISC